MNQISFLCNYDGCINIATAEAVTMNPRTSIHPLPRGISFLVTLEGRFCQDHVKMIQSHVFDVRAWLPQRDVHK
jgi:hypothetical protein